MNATTNPFSVRSIEEHIAPLRKQLTAHPLYRRIQTESHLHTFMESHVFAVWDFMSLLKALQSQITSVTVPWVPKCWPESRRFINEIVLGEESDVYQGRALSHFELYLEAMDESGAETSTMRDFLSQIGACSLSVALQNESVPAEAQRFMLTTFDLIQTGDLPAIAAAFTFGREDLIPDMFRNLVNELNRQNPGRFSRLIWYLQRHIEVDGDDHGPLSLRLVSDLCGSDERLWEQAAIAAESAILARLALWDGILARF